MSPSIWMRCGGRSNLRALDAKPWRVVESQQRISTRQLVDSDAEHDALEALVERGKPPLSADSAFADLHFLLFSPFRYPPLAHGSRFGRRTERSLWYGSLTLAAAFAEVAYYRLLFLEATSARLAPNRIPMSAFQAHIRSAAAIDLTLPPFVTYSAVLESKTSYTATQRLGSEMRHDGVACFRYTSARDPSRGVNLALFTPATFAQKQPLGPPEAWHCTVTGDHDISFMREEVAGLRKMEFRRSVLVGGKLPRI